MFHAAAYTSGIVSEDTLNFEITGMVGLGFNNTGETTAKIGGRTVEPGASYPVNGDIPFPESFMEISFSGEGKNLLEYSAQIVPASKICQT